LLGGGPPRTQRGMLPMMKVSEKGLVTRRCIERRLEAANRVGRLFPGGLTRDLTTSAVLFTVGPAPFGAFRDDPCLILNKRSQRVKQPGDLCFPGGRTAPRLDCWLSKVLQLPLSPLTRWPGWPAWRRERPREARRLALLLATGLRESFEEMRLNPFGVSFLGPLPSHSLEIFQRVIYPMVGWVGWQKRFRPNWEVEKVVCIPLRHLLQYSRYACYRVEMQGLEAVRPGKLVEDFPCFVHEDGGQRELLWGATYRIVMLFLEVVFNYSPPPERVLPVIHGVLKGSYFSALPSQG